MSWLSALVPPEYRILAAAGAATLAIAGIGAVVGSIYLHGRAAGIRAEAPKVAAAQGQAAAAQAQGGLTAAGAAIPAAADRQALDITLHAETAAHAIEQAPGASGVVPPDVLRGWAAGVDGVRDEAAAYRAGGPTPGASGQEPARPVPTPGAA